MSMTRNFGFTAKPVYRPNGWLFVASAALWLTFVFGGAVLLGWLP